MDYTIISTYLDYCKTHKRLSSHTIRAYKNDLIHFFKSDNDCVISYIENLTHTEIKPNTFRRKIASLKVFYNYLVTQNLVIENPFNGTHFKYRTEKTLPKIIPHNFLKDIYTYLKFKVTTSKTDFQRQNAERNLLIVSLLLSTGIRISELCHIQINNINLKNQTLNIIGKGKKERIIFLGDEITVRQLEKYISNFCNQSDNYLFTGKFSQKPLTEQSVRLMLKTVQEQLNLPITITPHMFRHSFATMLLDNDVDIRYIQQLLGHSSITVTQIYTHVSQSKLKEILSSRNPIATFHS